MTDDTLSERRGRRWLAAVAALAALLALGAPLSDPDLPEHLALGEWIVRHGAFPRVEPFAWTRAGQPYFAYSWLAQTTYYALLAAAGPLALHVLHALIGAGAVLAAALFARTRGWGRGEAAALGALNYAAMASVANELRPEQLLFVFVPLAWALAEVVARSPRGGRAGLLLTHASLGCAAANTHLFFPLTAAPLGMRLLAAPARARRAFLLPLLALVLGWLVSPYGLAWPAVFHLNFAPNALLRRPPIIAEMEPGFEAMKDVAGALVLALLLLALPWLRPARGGDGGLTGDAGDAGNAGGAGSAGDAGDAGLAGGASARARAGRERLVGALAWVLGLVLFAYAYRLLAVWWLLALPEVGVRLRAAAAALAGRRRTRAASVLALGVLMLVAAAPPWPAELRLEGGVRSRTLPTPAAAAARPLAGWLACHTAPGAGGRVLTAFNYGSYLTWRLPGFSVSMDSRTIFPDSIAREFALASAGRWNPHARTWSSAQLALLPRWMAANDSLRADTQWLRLATTGPADGRPGSARGAALWARRDWWARWRSPRSPSCIPR